MALPLYKQVARVMASPLYKQVACCVMTLPLFSKFKLAIVKVGNVSPSFSEMNS
jgi:hypothetical protein